jgi:hypothetical protein
MIALTACTQQPNKAPNVTLGAVITSGNSTKILNQSQMDSVKSITLNTTTNKTASTDTIGKNAAFTLTGTEGDLLTLKPKAVDPDGDKVAYTYSSPFSSNGLWQTKDGDAGKYLVTVTASDGELTTSNDVLVIINPSNKPPVIDCPASISLKEGESINLKCNFFDKENDPLVIEYSGWMTSATYTTNYDSAGDHKVFVKASDGNTNVSKTIDIHVENVDRAPIFNVHLKDLTVVESDIVTLNPNVTDPDGDTLKLTYSDPITSKGVWKTAIGDGGTYPISVVASDGTLTTKESFTLTVKLLNTAPVMKFIPNISVEEGEQVIIKPEVVDREKDPITITYSGWMKSSSYTTTYDDAYPKGCDKTGCAATYKVTVTASDGVFNATQDVYVLVLDKNRPPQFVWPGQ